MVMRQGVRGDAYKSIEYGLPPCGAVETLYEIPGVLDSTGVALKYVYGQSAPAAQAYALQYGSNVAGVTLKP